MAAGCWLDTQAYDLSCRFSAWVKGWSLEMQTGTLNWAHFAWPRGLKGPGKTKSYEIYQRDFPEFQPFGIDKVLCFGDT